MQHADGHTHLSHKVDASVDLETGIIAATGADLANVSDQVDCLERIDEAKAALEERGLSPATVAADKGRHSGGNLAGIEQRGLIPLISSPNQNRGEPGFGRADSRCDSEGDMLSCPAGQILTRLSKTDKIARHYKAKGSVCKSCPNSGVCTKNPRGRVRCMKVWFEPIGSGCTRRRRDP